MRFVWRFADIATFWDGTGEIQHFLTKSSGWGASLMMVQIELWAANSSAAHADRVGASYEPAGSVPFSLMPIDEWVHLAWTFDGSNLRVYLNGVDEEGPKAFSIGPDVDAQVEIGYNSNRPEISERTFHGSLDEVRIYDYALTEAEIQIVMQGGEGFPYAFGPTPADVAYHEATWVNISWKPGDFAVSHDVYIGDSFEEVDAGARGQIHRVQDLEDAFLVRVVSDATERVVCDLRARTLECEQAAPEFSLCRLDIGIDGDRSCCVALAAGVPFVQAQEREQNGEQDESGGPHGRHALRGERLTGTSP